MKLEEGMYVRTKKGTFSKILEIDKNLKYQNEDRLLVNEEDWFLVESDILKASHNIIDIIEVGDFIDGKQVVNAIHCKDGFNRIELFGGKAIMNKTPIKSIVTKQQFEIMSYKVGE